MRLSIVHTTTYRFVRKVQFHPHRLMLRPRGNHDLHVLEHALHCLPAAQLDWSQDVFGNLVCTAAFDQRATELEISSRLTVQTSAEAWPVFRIAPSAHGYPYEYAPEELADLGALRRPEHASSLVDAWARRFICRTPTDTLSLLKGLNAGVLEAAVYRPRDEEGTQTAAATLDMASGSCRDLAALFIEAARHLGFGARAVSGYLFDPAAGDLRSDTTHAWAEVYLPGAGWIAFDPTHGRVGRSGLVTVAIGRCNAQVMPVVGSYVGRPQDFLSMTVEVGAEAGPAAF